jgi:hypothetical protein
MLNDFVRKSHFIKDKRKFIFRLEKNKENFNLKSLLNYLLKNNSELNPEQREIIKKMIEVCSTYESFISVNVSYNNNNYNSNTYNNRRSNNSGNENNKRQKRRERQRSVKKVQTHFSTLGSSMDGWNPRGNHNYEAP